MRRGLPVLALLLLSSAAQAAERMPQLDFDNRLTISQIVWLVVIFAVLYVLLSRWALPKVGAVLEQRGAAIATDLETARGAKGEADAAVAEFTQATRDAQAAANARVAEAAAAAKEAAARQAAAQNATLDEQLAAAEQRIGAARSAALGALRQVAGETASAVVSRLTGRPADAGAIDAEIGAVMAARSQA